MNVDLISYTNLPENLISVAGKVCYSNESLSNIKKKVTNESSKKFVKNLMEFGHESPIEHASFTFGIEGVSRSLLAQITRHRIASFSVQSQRYVTEEDFSFVIPPKIEENEESKKVFLEFMENAKKCYSKLINILNETNKGEGGDSHNSKSVLRKSSEDARFVLPNACVTKFVVTMNARSLLNFFRLRCCNRAQWEIRALAHKMLSIVYKVAPEIFKNAGPSCINGGCGEGSMSCKKADEMRKKIEKIKSQEI